MKINENKTKEQNFVLQKWSDNNYTGIYQGFTGVGKTRIGVVAAAEFIRRNPAEKSIVIVPTTNLRDNEWLNQFNIWGYSNQLPNIEIACIQTAYKYTGRHYNTVVLDEVHTTLGDSYRSFLKNNTFDRILGLTATFDNEEHLKFITSIAPIIHVTDRKRALSLKLVSECLTFNLPVSFTDDEQDKYNQINSSFHFYEKALGGRLVAYENSKKFMKFNNIGKYGQNICVFTPENRVIYKSEVNGVTIPEDLCRHITTKELDELKERINQAKMYWKYMRQRKDICYSAVNKITVAKDIVNAFPDRKAIIFSEYTKVADKIQRAIGDDCVSFHSDMSSTAKKKALEDFSNNVKRSISCVKALNAGMDVPECSLGIETSGNSKKLASVQRTGRVSRFIKDKVAIYVNLYIKDTQEKKWLEKRVFGLDDVHWIEDISEIKV